MTLTEIIGSYTLPEGVTPVYNTLLGVFFRHEDGINWDTYQACMTLLAKFDVVDKEWFI